MKKKISRREFLGSTAGAALTGSLNANSAQGSVQTPNASSGAEVESSPDRISAYIPTQTQIDSIPIGALDDTFICKLSPDLIELDSLQIGNHQPFVKIQPKKSWELQNNFIGGTTTRLPRSRAFDFTPASAIHLIDGDLETFWACEVGEVGGAPPWLRVQFVKEHSITAVELWARKDRKAFPRRIEVQSSSNGADWRMIYASPGPITPDDAGRFRVEIEPHKAQEIRVLVTEAGDAPIWGFGFFGIKGVALTELVVLDERGKNVALASCGSNVFVSATEYGYDFKRMVQDQLWPIHYDIGFKYLRIAYWDSVLNWHFVEQEKGIYRIDPHIDGLLTETVQNGVEPVLCLAYTNWLYTAEGHRPNPRTQYEVPYEMAPAAFEENSPMFEGYINFVRFMVRYFRDRIHYFEIWNEMDVWAGAMTTEMYAKLVKATAPVIRAESPHAKILLGSVGGEWLPWKDERGRDRGDHIRIRYEYLKSVLEKGVVPHIDVIAWHPFYGTQPDDPLYRNYPQEVTELKIFAEKLGFKGSYMATEFAYWAKPGVPGQPGSSMGGNNTKLVKAKYAARVHVMHAGMGIPAFWNETYAFIFRPSSNGGLQPPYQPEPIYYVLRTLCTTLQSVHPASWPISIAPVDPVPMKTINGIPYYAIQPGEPAFPVVSYTFEMPSGSMLAVWYDGIGADNFKPIVVDLEIPQTATKVALVDIMNGVRQSLQVTNKRGKTVIAGLKVPDYPLLVEVS